MAYMEKFGHSMVPMLKSFIYLTAVETKLLKMGSYYHLW